MLVTTTIVWMATALALQQPAPSAPDAKAPPAASQPAREEEPVITHHEVHAGSRVLRYTATAGFLPLKSDTGDIEARVFFIAYTLDGLADPARRPLTISFNGGPGSSSVWLHLGALGPRRVRLQPSGDIPPPPFELVDNEFTWLDQTDLVFVDPVGTGYSRPARPDLGRRFWSLKGDIESMGEFIRLFLTRYRRWASPLFMVGESYGTTRAAGLAGYLIDRGVAFNGILLVSSVLNFQTIEFASGNDLPYMLYLPSYTATAWFHQKLAPDLQRDLSSAVRASEAWASSEYVVALARGDALDQQARERAAAQIARFTGLDPALVLQSNLRIGLDTFRKALLGDGRHSVGRLDSRFTSMDVPGSAQPDYDASLAAIRPPFTATFNDYVRRELNFSSDLPYHVLGGGFGDWDWGAADSGFPDTSRALAAALARNPHMQVFVASGYYDLATPYFATEYTLSHLGLGVAFPARVTRRHYEAGHMMYIDAAMLAGLRRDAGAFMTHATAADRPH